jgi:hypothetical protein
MTSSPHMLETSPTRAVQQGTAAAVVERIRAHARLQSAWMERLWSEGQTSASQGLAITPGEVHRILTDPALTSERYEQFLAEPEPRNLLLAAQDADATLAADAFWQHLAQIFDLTAPELDLLSLLVAVELDPHLTRVLAYLADDTRATAPTLLAASTLFAWAAEAPPAILNILRWRLARPLGDEPAWRVHSPWRVDEALVRSVREEHWIDPSLDRWSQRIEPATIDSLPLLYPEPLAQLLTHMRDPVAAPRPVEIALTGPEGSGRQTLAAQLAASLDRPLLAVRTPVLLANASAPLLDTTAYTNVNAAYNSLANVGIARELAGTNLVAALSIRDNDVELVPYDTIAGNPASLQGVRCMFSLKARSSGTLFLSGNRVEVPNGYSIAVSSEWASSNVITGNLFNQVGVESKAPEPCAVLVTAERALSAISGNVVNANWLVVPARFAIPAITDWKFLNTVL